MQSKTQPKTHEVKVKCSCGNTFSVISTRPSLNTEVCYACHPFYTGQSNVVDITGQVDKFKKRQAKTQSFKTNNKKKPKNNGTKPISK